MLYELFSCQVWLFSVLLGRHLVAPGGVELRPRKSLEVRGSPELQNGGLKALEEAWDDFLLEAFFCQVWSFSVLLGGLQVAPRRVELRPRRFLEFWGSPELQNGGLRALEEAWDEFCLRHFPVKSGRFLCFWGMSRWFQEVASCVPGGPSMSGEGQSSRMVA